MSARNPSEDKKNKSARQVSVIQLAVMFVISLVLFAVISVFCFVNGLKSVFMLTLMTAAGYACVFGLILIITALKHWAMSGKNGAESTETEDFPLGILARLDQPAAVCDESGAIVWMNKTFATRTKKGILISDDLEISAILDFRESEYVGLSKTELPAPSELAPKALFNTLIDNVCGASARGRGAFGGEFTVHAYPHISGSKVFFIIVLTEDTERNTWIRKYRDNLTHIAYIAVDNLAELAQSDQESYRYASNRVAAIIKDWGIENKAFLKEYEREKYVAVLSHKSLAEIQKKRFDLLESVSKVRIGTENLSVTISAGVSTENGVLEEKDKAAQAALEMALARGGNQAVIMGEPPIFFGAKSITSLKRSGVRHRVFAEKLVYRIQCSSNVIIMGHRNPDFDAIGSCIGLARLCMTMGKRVNIIANTEDQTLSECFAKVLKFPEYEGVFVDPIEAQELLTSNTLVVCVDVNNPNNFEAVNVAYNSDYLYVVDHHRQSENSTENIPAHYEALIVPSASSASELISEILEYQMPEGASLKNDEADIMFAGILLDTKNFTRNTQVPTFDAAIYLRNSGADPNKAQALFKIDLEGFRTESAFSTDLEIYKEFIVIAKEMGSESSPAKRITAAKTADKLLNIRNIRVSFVVARMLSDVFISARSDGSVNVQLIMETLRGGGHYNAAATMLKDMSVDEAVEKLKEAITLYFGNDGAQAPTPKMRRRRASNKTRKH